jgi:hypothetical protein
MKTKTVAVVANKKTGEIKSVEVYHIYFEEIPYSRRRWFSIEATKKMLKNKNNKILNINYYEYA